MGSVLSVIGAVAILYVYARRSNASDVGHDTTNSQSAINTKSAQDHSDEAATQGHMTKRSNSSTSSYFHSARNVDARHAMFSDVGGDQHINIAANVDPDRGDIGDWLSPLNFKLNQSEILQLREDGTGEWLLESSEFKDWRDGPSEILWCPGMPGAGKTVLSSIIVDHLQTLFKDCDVAILCIYCNYKEQLEQTAFNLVASLLKQLVEDDAAAYNNVKPLYECYRHKKTRPTFDEIQKALQLETARYSKTYIVVDALDESSDVDGTRGKLVTALRSLGRTVSLLVTSRDIASIAQAFHDSRHLEIRASEGDVRRYIEGRIPREPRLVKHVDGDHALREEMVKKITENVQGMFLLARLHMDSLATTISRKELRKGLENLPIEVNATYDETMKRIEGQIEGDRKLAEQVLSWVIYAHRQLSLAELQHALAVSPGMSEMDPDALVDESVLTSVCAGLVVIDNKSSTIHLVHYTAQEYFEGIRRTRFPDAQASITVTCLTYMSFPVVGPFSPESHALLLYALTNWGHHACGQVEVTHKEMILKFLQDNSGANIKGQKLQRLCQGFPQVWGLCASAIFGLEHITRYLLENNAQPDSTDHFGRTPLSYAVQHGHETVAKLFLMLDDTDVEFQHRDEEISMPCISAKREENELMVLCEKPIDVNDQQEQYSNLLLDASRRGHEGIVKLLLERGANTNVQRGKYGNALRAASYKGYDGIVKLLLEKGADINAHGGEYGNALQAASYQGHEGIVDLLLEKGADLNMQGGTYGNALLAASHKGCEGIVKLLLQKGVDINAQGGHYGNALQTASYEGHEGIVELLLENGADINVQGGICGNALLAASHEGYEGIVKLLLQKGVDIDAQERHYGSALQTASYKGHEEIVKLLIEKGADINAKGGHYGNALHAASYEGHEGIVELLLEKGADINAQRADYSKALQMASYQGPEGIAKLLLENGVGINSQTGHYGDALQEETSRGYEGGVMFILERLVDINADQQVCSTALQAASYRGHKGIVKRLLEKGGDTNAQRGYYDSALQAASIEDHEAIVKLLLEKGADSNAQGGYHGNALQAASCRGHEGIVMLLLEERADINMQGGYYGNALQAASCRGHEGIVKVLLEKGADINSQGGYYGNALQAASSQCHEGIVKLLLKKGADINAQGGYHGTALKASSSEGNEGIVKLLLENGADDIAQGQD